MSFIVVDVTEGSPQFSGHVPPPLLELALHVYLMPPPPLVRPVEVSLFNYELLPKHTDLRVVILPNNTYFIMCLSKQKTILIFSQIELWLKTLFLKVIKNLLYIHFSQSRILWINFINVLLVFLSLYILNLLIGSVVTRYVETEWPPPHGHLSISHLYTQHSRG